jgi:hypothetical protein
MRHRFSAVSILCSGAFFCAFSIGTAIPASAACKVQAYRPELVLRPGSREIHASARRYGCSASGPLYIQLRHHRGFWFDEALKTVLIRGAQNNVRYRMVYRCPQAIRERRLFVKGWGLGAEEGVSSYPRLLC